MSSPRIPDEFPPDFDFGALLDDIAHAEAQDQEALTREPAPVVVEPPPSQERVA